MAKTKEQKKQIIEDIKNSIDKQKAMYFIDFKGMSANDINSFRIQLRENDAEMCVAKKTLAGLAFKDKKIDYNLKDLEGQIAVIFGFGDAFAPTKALSAELKKDKIKILGGIYEHDGEQKNLTVEEVLAISKLPTRDELLARLLGSINAPISGFVSVLNGNIKGLVTVLGEIRDQKN